MDNIMQIFNIVEFGKSFNKFISYINWKAWDISSFFL